MSKKACPKGHLPASAILRAVPYKNEAMELTRRSDGTVLAEVPIRRPRWLVPPISWLLPYSSHRRVELDVLGTTMLDMCNGEDNVERIIERFAAKHKLTFREAQLATVEFLDQLTQRGLLAIVGTEKDAVT